MKTINLDPNSDNSTVFYASIIEDVHGPFVSLLPHYCEVEEPKYKVITDNGFFGSHEQWHASIAERLLEKLNLA